MILESGSWSTKESPLITELPLEVTDLSLSVTWAPDPLEMEGHHFFLILRNSELSYEQRSGAINKKEEQLEQGRVYQRIVFLSF